ncbi:MAG: SLBB domain-containing protein [Solirubrobacterales bacterium]
MELAVDMDRIERARLYTGPYRVVPGDVLEFTMAPMMQAVSAAELHAVHTPARDDRPYVSRINSRGAIILPALGELKVEGLSLVEIEERAAEAYQPYVVQQPPIFARVLEYKTAKVYITGAVEEPGVYTLRSDQMTLVSLITEAKGISESGAAVVRIIRSKDQNTSAEGRGSENAGRQGRDSSPDDIVLPVVGMNVPFRDVALDEGDTVVVEQIHMPLFSVLGLVVKPGNFEYPPMVEYNLAQAIAFAGGLDPIADPRYATIYRLNGDGSIVRIPFKLVEKNALTEALGTSIRPGDVVTVEHTPRTRLNTNIYNLLRINMGVYLSGDDLWNRD